MDADRTPEPLADMPPVIPAAGGPAPGYRRLGTQQVRMDMAEKLLREVHEIRVSRPGKTFAIDPARGESAIMPGYGLEPFLAAEAVDHLLELAGPAWENGRWADGILRVLDGLDQWLETIGLPDEGTVLAAGEF